MKILFACDLDNTLIHSHKKRRADDICVEIYENREQSFISRKSLDLLKKISEKIMFIPVTTRSIAQYRRIFWTKDFQPKISVVANGSYLLSGENRENFLREVVKPYENELKIQFEVADENIFNIKRIVDESFLFLRCRDDINAEKIIFDTNLTVQRTGKKIYLFPPSLTKGNALKKLAKKLSPDKILAAGDSEIDLSMLEVADVAFFPKNLGKNNFVTCSEAPDFAEEFLERITKIFGD